MEESVFEKLPKSPGKRLTSKSKQPLAATAAFAARPLQIAVVMLMAPGFAWAYWPTLVQLASTWSREPDYSHGYLVTPLAIGLMWMRRKSFPPVSVRFAWWGLLLLGAGVAVRISGALLYLDAADGWSIPLVLGAVVWLLYGWNVFLWSAPCLAFLWFMVPLPYQVDLWFSLPLQRIATKISCFGLQFLGQPALAEGNTIWLRESQIEVEQACSGLRILMAIAAMVFAYVIVARISWWERVLVAAAIAPIALAANAARIIATGMIQQYASTESARTFTHDTGGWLMIVFAAAMFAMVMWYLGRLFPKVEQISMKSGLNGPTG